MEAYAFLFEQKSLLQASGSGETYVAASADNTMPGQGCARLAKRPDHLASVPRESCCGGDGSVGRDLALGDFAYRAA